MCVCVTCIYWISRTLRMMVNYFYFNKVMRN